MVLFREMNQTFAADHVLQDARDPVSGNLDATRLAELMGLTMRDLGNVLKRDPTGLTRHPTSRTLQPALRHLETLCLDLKRLLGSPELMRMWLKAPHPMLEEQTPAQLIVERGPGPLEQLVRMADNGMPS